jgi:hypothetical protein
MKIDYILENSETGFVNKLADFILKRLNTKGRTKIKVTDFSNFIVVEGQTDNKIILNMNQIKDGFRNEYKSYLNELKIENFNIIDIIKYDESVPKNGIHFFSFYKSKRPLYHNNIIEFVNSSYEFLPYLNTISYTDRLLLHSSQNTPINDNNFIYTDVSSVSSSFPYGHSNKLGRTELLYCEYVANHLFNILNVDEIHFKLDLIQRVEETDEIGITTYCDSLYDSKVIESLILDVFDFNFIKFESEYLSNYDMSLELSDPFGDKPWLVKDKINDLIII